MMCPLLKRQHALIFFGEFHFGKWNNDNSEWVYNTRWSCYPADCEWVCNPDRSNTTLKTSMHQLFHFVASWWVIAGYEFIRIKAVDLNLKVSIQNPILLETHWHASWRSTLQSKQAANYRAFFRKITRITRSMELCKISLEFHLLRNPLFEGFLSQSTIFIFFTPPPPY